MDLNLIDNSYTVKQFSDVIKTQLESLNKTQLYIKGDITSIKISGQHMYFDVKDEDATLGCCYFMYQYKGVIPKEGETAILRGKVSYYSTAKTSKISYIVDEIITCGEGALRREFEKLKAKLESEGYFAQEHKKHVPAYPRNVLILTSKTHAVIQDIVRNIRRKNKYIDIVVKDVRVQGMQAAKELCNTLVNVDKLGYDVIIVARGGGSLGDLAPFYDENLVKTVYNMHTPVISAIGHETDHSLLDFVADMRASTPTEAAQIVGYSVDDLITRVANIARAYNTILATKYNKVTQTYRDNVNALSNRFKDIIHMFEKRIKDKAVLIDQAIKEKYLNAEQRLVKEISNLEILNPQKVFERGYYTISNAKGQVLDVSKVKVNDTLTVVGKGGKIKVNVIEKMED